MDDIPKSQGHLLSTAAVFICMYIFCTSPLVAGGLYRGALTADEQVFSEVLSASSSSP